MVFWLCWQNWVDAIPFSMGMVRQRSIHLFALRSLNLQPAVIHCNVPAEHQNGILAGTSGIVLCNCLQSAWLRWLLEVHLPESQESASIPEADVLATHCSDQMTNSACPASAWAVQMRAWMMVKRRLRSQCVPATSSFGSCHHRLVDRVWRADLIPRLLAAGTRR